MGWEELQAILKQQRRDATDEANKPPVACPIDGTVLDVRPDGTRNCPLGNYRWP